jgi:hypothetical protein
MANTKKSGSDEGGDKGAVDLAIYTYHQLYILL